MASNAAVPFWRAAGMTYITYSNLCANLVRNCLKEPRRAEALAREKVHFSVSKWVDGKPQKPIVNFYSFVMMVCGLNIKAVLQGCSRVPSIQWGFLQKLDYPAFA
ncbi:hypothetical protein ACH5RR_007833 [Cinchona calisaya]|uniref:ATP synthase subunit epsilon, mitochondrial n=1 Tax=Cinchona calisaya TaxID=153742 RepID=A0ABD3A9P3_9GENT